MIEVRIDGWDRGWGGIQQKRNVPFRIKNSEIPCIELDRHLKNYAKTSLILVKHNNYHTDSKYRQMQQSN